MNTSLYSMEALEEMLELEGEIRELEKENLILRDMINELEAENKSLRVPDIYCHD